MSNTPPEKKRKSLDGTAISSSWREKSIDKFNLQPVPDKWKDSVSVGSEEHGKDITITELIRRRMMHVTYHLVTTIRTETPSTIMK